MFEKTQPAVDHEKEMERMYTKIGQLEMERDFLKKLKEAGAMTERPGMVNRKESLSIRCNCDLVSASRGSFYCKPPDETGENLHIMRLMDEHYLERPVEEILRMKDFISFCGYCSQP